MSGVSGRMQVLDRTGHTEIVWDPTKMIDVDIARAAFDEAIKKGYSAFRVEGEDQRGARISTFDPKAAKIMLVPQLVGG